MPCSGGTTSSISRRALPSRHRAIVSPARSSMTSTGASPMNRRPRAGKRTSAPRTLNTACASETLGCRTGTGANTPRPTTSPGWARTIAPPGHTRMVATPVIAHVITRNEEAAYQVPFSRELLHRVLNVLEAVDLGLAGDLLAAAHDDRGPAPPAGAPPPGPMRPSFEDRYEVLEEALEGDGVIGQGGTGRVQLARDRLLGRIVAVKRPRPNLPRDQLEILIKEALRAAGLFHPGVLPVFDLLFDHSGQACIILPLIPRGTWIKRLREITSSTAPTTRAHEGLRRGIGEIIQVARTLQHLHSCGLVHGDVKPENIGLGEHGEVFLIDFGASTSRVDDDANSADHGTPAWLPGLGHPARDMMSPRRDIWAVGWLLRCLCTSTTSPSEVMPFPQELRELEYLWTRATSPDPSAGPELSAIVAGLDDWLADRPVVNYPYTRQERIRRVATRRGPEILMGVLITLVAVALLVAGFSWRDAQAARRDYWLQDAARWLREDPERARLAAAMSLQEGETASARGLYVATSALRTIRLMAKRSIDGGCSDVAWRQDGSMLACAVSLGGVRLMRAPDLTPIREILHDKGVLSVQWTESDRLVMGTADGEVMLFDLASGKSEVVDAHRRGNLPQHVGQIATWMDGAIISAGDSTEVRWSRTYGATPEVLYRGQDSIGSIAMIGNHLFLVDKGLRHLRLGSEPPEVSLVASTEGAASVVGAPDAEVLALSSINATEPVYLLQVFTHEQEPRITAAISNFWGGVWAAEFVPGSKGERVVLGGASGAIAVWSSKSRRVEAEIRGAEDRQGNLAASPDGNLLASADGTRSLAIWDIKGAVHRPLLPTAVLGLRVGSGSIVEAVSDVGATLSISRSMDAHETTKGTSTVRATGWLPSGHRVEGNYEGEVWVEKGAQMKLLGRIADERWHLVDCDGRGCVGASLTGGVFSVDAGGALRWTTSSGTIRGALGGTPVGIVAIAAAGDEVVVAPNADRVIHLDRETGVVREVEVIPAQHDFCGALAVLPEGVVVCVVRAGLFALNPVRRIASLDGLQDVYVERLLVDERNNYLIAGDMQGGIHVYGLGDYSAIAHWTNPDGWITAMAISETYHLWTGTLNGAVGVWDLAPLSWTPAELLADAKSDRWRVDGDQIVPIPVQ